MVFNPEDIVRVIMSDSKSDDFVTVAVAVPRRHAPFVVSVDHRGQSVESYPFEVDELHAVCVAQHCMLGADSSSVSLRSLTA